MSRPPALRFPALHVHDDDDGELLAFVQDLAEGVVTLGRPRDLYLVRVDHWFGPRWLGFAGKAYRGLVGVTRSTERGDLVIPPFVPRRVVSERHLSLCASSVGYVERRVASPLHVRIWSEANLRRELKGRSRDATFVWVSGASRTTDRAAMMVISLREAEQEAWYAGFVRREGGHWSYGHLSGIGRDQLDRWRHAAG